MNRNEIMQKKKILIVEDEAVISLYIQNSLVNLGFEICGHAISGEEAVRMARELSPDIILMDIVLQGAMDGIEAAKLIRDRLGIPVIYMTGNADMSTVTRARDSAPYGYVLKPIDLLHLFSTIDAVIHRRDLELRLTESEEKYRNLVEEINDVIYSLDENGMITFISPRIKNETGYSYNDVIGQSFVELVYPEDRQKVMSIFQKRLEGFAGSYEFRVNSKGGEPIWVQTSSMPLVRDGVFRGVRGVISNISERKKTEETLRMLGTAVEQVVDGIAVSDQDGNILYANRAWVTMHGLTKADIPGSKMALFHTEEQYGNGVLPFLEKVRLHGSHEGEVGHVRRDGSVFLTWMSASILQDDRGIPSRYVGVARDITGQKEAERALKESEERFRAVVNNLQDLIVVMDSGGVVNFENPAVATRLGYSMIDKSAFDIVHPDDIQVVIKDFGEVVSRTNPGIPTEFRILHNDGSWIYVDALATNMTDNSIIRGILVVLRDIDQRVQVQKALGESEERYRALFNQSPVGVFKFDTDLKLTDCNERLGEIMRAPRDKLVGLNLRKLKHSLVVPQLEDTLKGNVNHYEGEYDSTLSSVRLWIAVSASPLRDETGKVIGGMAVLEDITDRYRAEEGLRLSEERNRLLVENASEGIAVIRDWRFVFVNPQLLKLTGYAMEEMESRTFTEFIHPDDREMISGRYRKRLAGDTSAFIYEVRFLTSAGDVRWTELNSVLFRWQDGDAVLIFIRDITERKTAEEERRKIEAQIQVTQKLESLGVLAGGIAHDFNNLLMAILGNIDLALMDMTPSSPVRSNLLEAAKASQRAADLCRQMLAYSGRGRFSSEAIDLNEAVEEMGHMLEVSISKKALLRYNFAGGLPAIDADATQIRQIIMNLVINASDAIGERSGIISISTGAIYCDREFLSETWLNEQLPAGLYAYVEVADTGCGMDRETLPRIFDPFFTTKFTGRGLGLAAVLGIVRSHRGAIKVYSETGRGTTFKVLFPTLEKPAERPDGASEPGNEWRGSGTVLLADDEETIRTLGGSMLTRLGFSVITAENGIQALEIFSKHADEIAFVILDLTMPRMDGEETYRELRRVRKDVTVIMSSGYNEQEITQRFAGKGIAGFIQKPYQMADLAAALRKILK